MTVGEKYLMAIMEDRYRGQGPGAIVEALLGMGVVDRALCKTLVIREFVAQKVSEGNGKVDAMRQAGAKFGCSLASVKKCIYYNTNINLIK